nr:MAG TPA: hypothetical protein [Caudoviricetes sp.]
MPLFFINLAMFFSKLNVISPHSTFILTNYSIFIC